ncbi:hypothetical protein DFH06DRAFT_1317336 [Mycena polygramma]|nr:hypothetical protein DFH06DRAFT_1317336 [Mycena polygramma]
MAFDAYLPAKSKHHYGPSPYQIDQERRARRNEQARLRMAEYAQLKLKSAEEQARVAAVNKEYQARYRQKNRKHLVKKARARRGTQYRNRYGPEMYLSYESGQRERSRRARARRRAAEAYDGDADGNPQSR